MNTQRLYTILRLALLIIMSGALTRIQSRTMILEHEGSSSIDYSENIPYDPAADAEAKYISEIHADTLTFEQSSIALTGIHGGNASWFDYDNDGDLDILLSGASDSGYVTKIYRNDNGSFIPLTQSFVGVAPEHTVTWGDFDNDGDYDFFIAGNTSATDDSGRVIILGAVSKIYRNDNGTFVDLNADIIGLRGGGAAWGDYDNDGDLDLVVTGSPDNGGTFVTKLYRNDGGEFVEVLGTPFPGVWGASVAWGDYDNDGDLDLLMSGWGGDAITQLFRNDGGTFTPVAAPFPAVASSAVAFADYNNDGYLDVTITGMLDAATAVTKLYRNLGDGTFVEATFSDSASFIGIGVGAIAWGDIDNDGDLDLIISGSQDFGGSQPTTVVYRNDQTTFTRLPDDIQNGWTSSLSLGDYDNDGRLDLLYSGASTNYPPYGSKTLIYRNIYPGTNTPPDPPGNLSAIPGTNSVQFSWDRSFDNETARQGLTYNLRVGQSPGAIDVLSPNSNVGTGFRRVPLQGNTNTTTSAVVKNLSPGIYYWGVQSVDNAYSGSAFTSEHSFIIQGIARWELISLPFFYPDYRKSVLFPNAVSHAFSYSGIYNISPVLTNGLGYWMKFSQQSPHSIQSGTAIDSITIPVKAGWNIIGSVSVPLPVASIAPIGTVIQSPVFGYDGAYKSEDTLFPGSGYWVRVSDPGSLALLTSAGAPSLLAGKRAFHQISTDDFNSLRIENGTCRPQHLFFGKKPPQSFSVDSYELPPVPPQVTLDARFKSQRMLEINEGKAAKQFPILISSASYPVTISWNMKNPIAAAITVGKRTISMDRSGTVDVQQYETPIVLEFSGGVETPRTFSLAQNYPNPFNPATEIRYELRDAGFVSVKVYDLLGEEVADLVNENKTAGVYSVSWDASAFSSGIYFCRMKAGTFSHVIKLVLVR